MFNLELFLLQVFLYKGMTSVSHKMERFTVTQILPI